MLRTPIKTVSFVLLIVLSVCLFSLGVSLLIVSGENIEEFEASYITIGTVRQIADATDTIDRWDAGWQVNTYNSRPVYDTIMPLSVLDFDGANYIHPPEKRPFYGAYMPGFIIGAEPEWEAQRIKNMESVWFRVIEIKPLEDCVPSQPVRVKLVRVLFGTMSGPDEIWFCDHNRKDPPPMSADKTYIMDVTSYPLSLHSDFSQSMEFEYVPSTGWMDSSQVDSNGQPVLGLLGTGDYWTEVTDGNYDTPRGRQILAYIEGLKRYIFTIPVKPTNSTNLIMAFYNGNAAIVEGRDIKEEEYASGERVCLVQRNFARNNGLTVGDALTLPLYCADYSSPSAGCFPPDSSGFPRSNPVNAQGELYHVFDSGTYTIVGIYDSRSGAYETKDFDMGYNEVVIPAASVKNSDENNIIEYGPMRFHNTSFQIPNGTIDDYTEAWNKLGITNLEIEFYDNGYTKLIDGLETIKSVALVLLLSGVAATVLVLVFFTYMFISKQKKRTAIERSLGLSKARCVLSLLSGLLLVVLLGSATGGAVGFILNRSVMNTIISTSQAEAYDTSFSGWINNADEQAALSPGNYSTSPSVFIFAGLAVALTAVLFATVGVIGNLKSEPLKMLSTREE